MAYEGDNVEIQTDTVYLEYSVLIDISNVRILHTILLFLFELACFGYDTKIQK